MKTQENSYVFLSRPSLSVIVAVFFLKCERSVNGVVLHCYHSPIYGTVRLREILKNPLTRTQLDLSYLASGASHLQMTKSDSHLQGRARRSSSICSLPKMHRLTEEVMSVGCESWSSADPPLGIDMVDG